jgi:hypothetical protein
LLSAIAGLAPEKMSTPVVDQWSVKDLLTHVTSWDEFMALDYDRLGRGDVPAFNSFTEEMLDPFNATIMALRRAFPAEQALAELRPSRDRVRQSLDSLDESHFAQGFVPATLVLTADHDVEHAAHIREWRKAQGI